MSSVLATDDYNYGIDEFTKADLQRPNDTTTFNKQATMEEAMAQHTRSFFFTSTVGRVVVVVSGTEMIYGLVQDIGRLMALKQNWNSYDAPPIDPRIAIKAMEFSTIIQNENLPKPSVVPTNEGGIQFEWHTNGIDLEIEFGAQRDVFGYFYDANTKEEWEGDLGIGLQPIRDTLTKLSE